MTFDEILDEMNANQEPSEAIRFMERLHDIYAPTVEMTKAQHDLIFRTKDDDKLYEIMGDGDGYYFNTEYWGKLSPNQVASAYLHPETIKIVEEVE